jgi:hypothetical protein
LTDGPQLRPQTRVRVVLEGPGVTDLSLEGVSLSEHATLDRVSPTALEFIDPNVRQQEFILELVLCALERASTPAALVCHRCPMCCVAAAKELDMLGWRVVLAMTPLGCIRWLSDPDVRTEAILFALPPDAENGTEMLSFVRNEFPEVRRIALRRQSDDGVQQLPPAGYADVVLNEPWTHSELKAALHGIFPPCGGLMGEGAKKQAQNDRLAAIPTPLVTHFPHT